MRHLNSRPFADDAMARSIAAKWGTPTFVYSETLMREAAMRCLTAVSGSEIDLTVRYAMKANSTRAILQLFDSLGLRVDASSGFEARRAMMAGIAPEKIQLTAQELPGDLAELVFAGVGFNACSIRQMKTFARIFPGCGLGLRVNPGFGGGHSRKTTVGGPYAAFGIWHEELDEAIGIARSSGLMVRRVHVHVGSGADSDVATHAARFGAETLGRFPVASVLNLGGGFPVARMDDESSPDIASVVLRYAAELTDLQRVTGRRIRLEIEPGAYLTANAGILLATIRDVKRAGRREFIVIDAGMSEFLRPTLYGARHPVWLHPRTERGTGKYAVVGHCCESGDIITTRKGSGSVPAARVLPVAEVGDLLLVGGAGAYCAAMSAKNYNSFPEAAEVMIGADGEPRLIRRRQSLEQMTENEL